MDTTDVEGGAVAEIVEVQMRHTESISTTSSMPFFHDFGAALNVFVGRKSYVLDCANLGLIIGRCVVFTDFVVARVS